MNEKSRMLFLAVFAFICFVIVSMIDGWFTVMAVQPYKWVNLRFWLVAMSVALSMISLSAGLGSLLGDYGNWSFEDYFALILLTAQPWILIWSGFLDAISRTVQGHLWSEPFLGWVSQDFAWAWLNPPNTNGVPLLPYLLSRVGGYMTTMTLSVVLGSIIGVAIVVALWIVYWYEA